MSLKIITVLKRLNITLKKSLNIDSKQIAKCWVSKTTSWSTWKGCFAKMLKHRGITKADSSEEIIARGATSTECNNKIIQSVLQRITIRQQIQASFCLEICVTLANKAVAPLYASSSDRMGSRSILIFDEEKIFLINLQTE